MNCQGQKAEVIETIDNAKGSGTVRLRGVEWMARSVDDTVIEEGKVVTIQSVSGVKLLDKRVIKAAQKRGMEAYYGK